jgi:GntR family transcriptional regulator
MSVVIPLKIMDTHSIFKPTSTWAGEAHDNTPLDQRVAEQIREMIMEGKLGPETQLPKEPDLSSLLNVSRSTIRSALTILEQGGFILRRRGVGTFIAKNPPAYNNLNINSGVTQLIRSSGAAPGCIETLITTRGASEHIANRLSIEPGTSIVVIERVRLANDRRTVFTQDYLPQALFRSRGDEITLSDIEEFLEEHQSMYAFLRVRCGMEIHHGIAWMRPLLAEGYIAEKLQLPRGSSTLHIEQVDFTSDGVPFALADEYYVADAFTFSVYRTA